MMAHVKAHPELSVNALAVGVMLADGAWWNASRGVFEATVRQEVLGAKARVKRTTVKNALDELERAGILARHGNWRTNTGSARRMANSYDIRPHASIQPLSGSIEDPGDSIQPLSGHNLEPPRGQQLPTSLPTNGNISATTSQDGFTSTVEGPREGAGELASLSLGQKGEESLPMVARSVMSREEAARQAQVLVRMIAQAAERVKARPRSAAA
jgi:hypothetical protein